MEDYGTGKDGEMLRELITALQDQTTAITSLVESNQRLMMMLVDGMSDEDAPARTTYLDGSKA